MTTVSESRWQYLVGALVAILIWSVCSAACEADDGKRIVVFVQATKDTAVNQMVMDRYLWNLFQGVDRPGEFFQLDMYPINANTAATAAFFSAEVRHPEFQSQERRAARNRFLTLRKILDQTYGAKESELVDVLGSLRVIDEALAKAKDKEPLYVIYVSDMVQNNGADGYDFTGYHGGKSLDECRRRLEHEVGAMLRHRKAFRHVQVLVVKLDLKALFRIKGTELEPPPKNMSEIDTFWETTVFQSLLHADSYQVARSQRIRDEVAQFLSDKRGKWWDLLGLSIR